MRPCVALRGHSRGGSRAISWERQALLHPQSRSAKSCHCEGTSMEKMHRYIHPGPNQDHYRGRPLSASTVCLVRHSAQHPGQEGEIKSTEKCKCSARAWNALEPGYHIHASPIKLIFKLIAINPLPCLLTGDVSVGKWGGRRAGTNLHQLDLRLQGIGYFCCPLPGFHRLSARGTTGILSS
jgi:hypothetical protein